MSEQVKSRKGFASMGVAKRREIASMGGKKAHEVGRAHKWTAEEAREAGRKGGSARAARAAQRQKEVPADVPSVSEALSDVEETQAEANG